MADDTSDDSGDPFESPTRPPMAEWGNSGHDPTAPLTKEQHRSRAETLRNLADQHENLAQVIERRRDAAADAAGDQLFDPQTQAKANKYFDLAAKAGLVWRREQYHDVIDTFQRAMEEGKAKRARGDQDMNEFATKTTAEIVAKAAGYQLERVGRVFDRRKVIHKLIFGE